MLETTVQAIANQIYLLMGVLGGIIIGILIERNIVKEYWELKELYGN